MFSERRRAVVSGGLLVLLAMAALALGGTVPEYTAPRPRPPATGPAAGIVMLVLVVLALAILAIGLVSALRRGVPAAVAPASSGRQIEIARPTRRQVVIAVAVVVAVLALFAALGAIRVAERESDDRQQTTQSSDGNEPNGNPRRDDSQPAEPTPDERIFDWIALAGVALVAVSLVGVAALAARSRPEIVVGDQVSGTAPDESSATVSESLARAAELGLAEMAEPGRDPREAIIACYAAMESALADAPDVAPRASDTPSEVLERAVAHGVLRTGAAAELVALFTEARFSPHRMRESHRASATQHLRAVLDDVRVVRSP